MKIFKKTHFWKDNRTFLEIEFENPKIERNYPSEGSFLLKIGEQTSIKSAFKLTPDEARALKDSLSLFLKEHDKKMSELMSNDYESQNQYNYSQNNYSDSSRNNYSNSRYEEDSNNSREDYSFKPEYTKMPSNPNSSSDNKENNFFIFGDDKEKKEEKKPNVEFYF